MTIWTHSMRFYFVRWVSQLYSARSSNFGQIMTATSKAQCKRLVKQAFPDAQMIRIDVLDGEVNNETA